MNHEDGLHQENRPLPAPWGCGDAAAAPVRGGGLLLYLKGLGAQSGEPSQPSWRAGAELHENRAVPPARFSLWAELRD